MRYSLRNETGMTIVEVVIAMLLATVVILAILVTVVQNAGISDRIDRIYTCSNLAQSRIEDIKRLDFGAIDGSVTETDVKVDIHGALDASGEYIRTTETAGDYKGNPYMLKVKISVDKIIDGSPSGHPVVVETILADVK